MERNARLLIVGGGVAGLYAALSRGRRGRRPRPLEGRRCSPRRATSRRAAWPPRSATATPRSCTPRTRSRAGRGLCRRAPSRCSTRTRRRGSPTSSRSASPSTPTSGPRAATRATASSIATAPRPAARSPRVLAEHVLRAPAHRVSEGERVARRSGGRRPLRRRRHRPARDRGARDAARDRRLRPRCGSARRTRAARSARGSRSPTAPGAAVADLEFVQFHPTALARRLPALSEALRGAGRAALDADGERFIDELAPRDVVARAIAARGTAMLDLRADRPRAASRACERARGGGLRPGARAGPGLAGRALHDGRSRHRPRRTHGAAGPLRRGRVRLHGRPRRQPARVELDARVPRLRPARRARRARASRAARLGRAAARPPPRPPVDAGAPRRALARTRACSATRAGLERLLGATAPARAPRRASALAREESRGGHFRADFPHEDPALRRRTPSCGRPRAGVRAMDLTPTLEPSCGRAGRGRRRRRPDDRRRRPADATLPARLLLKERGVVCGLDAAARGLRRARPRRCASSRSRADGDAVDGRRRSRALEGRARARSSPASAWR